MDQYSKDPSFPSFPMKLLTHLTIIPFLGVCHRMLDVSNPKLPVVKEVFFDFVELERTNSENVCKKLFECYKSRSIDLEKVRGQTYDTTSSMSSVVNGVHGRFQAFYCAKNLVYASVYFCVYFAYTINIPRVVYISNIHLVYFKNP